MSQTAMADIALYQSLHSLCNASDYFNVNNTHDDVQYACTLPRSCCAQAAFSWPVSFVMSIFMTTGVHFISWLLADHMLS